MSTTTQTPPTIHTTIGVYNNGDMKINGVTSKYLQTHIQYNKDTRPGRALFVDGKCVHSGYLDEARVKELEKQLKDIKVTKDTAPYH